MQWSQFRVFRVNRTPMWEWRHPLWALRQSCGERAVRDSILGITVGELVRVHAPAITHRGLDIGCQTGLVTDALAQRTSLQWYGIDPRIRRRTFSANGTELLHGWAHEIPFGDSHFDCVGLVNVYEHLDPTLRNTSLVEISRVLTEDGILVGHLPNPYFPIEPHSRLPFMGYLPLKAQKQYWRLAPARWSHDFYAVTVGDLRRRAERLGFETVIIRHFNYPVNATPRAVHLIYWLLLPVMRVVPWAWQFVFRKA